MKIVWGMERRYGKPAPAPAAKVFFTNPMHDDLHQDTRECRVFLTGVTSIHGWSVFKSMSALLPQDAVYAIRPPKMDVPAAPNVEPLCITDRKGLERIARAFRPTHVVHCAGVCDLDVCEQRPRWARMINTVGSRTVAEVFGSTARVVYAGSDLVFSGDTTPEGGYHEDSAVDPVSVAGKTLAEAECEITRCAQSCVIRLGLPLGPSITGEKGAVDFIESRFRRNLPVTLFRDEFRSCIGCDSIGEIVSRVAFTGLTGLYHLGGPRKMSLYEIGTRVLANGPYLAGLLKGIYRREERDGPPRIGDVSLNCGKLRSALGLRLSEVIDQPA